MLNNTSFLSGRSSEKNEYDMDVSVENFRKNVILAVQKGGDEILDGEITYDELMEWLNEEPENDDGFNQ